MATQRYSSTIRQPIPLRISIPRTFTLDEEDDDARVLYPYAPPPTPYVQRRETPLDAQRYDPHKSTVAASSPQVNASFETDDSRYYPQLEDSVAYHLEARDAYDELLDYHLSEQEVSDDSPDSSPDSGETTPTDESGNLSVTKYHSTGVDGDGEYSIERTVLRPAPRRFDLSKSLATLATRSTATLRTMPSFSRSSGTTTPSSEEDPGVVAPPVSRAISRRPSIAMTPLPISEVTESLKRLATRLIPQSGSDSHFEEAVDHYEDVWSREERGEPLIEVFITHTQETFVEAAARCDLDEAHAMPHGIGLYASGQAVPESLRG
ncbi:hypothetical protein BV20DRAFT_627933 [Pilatotrama ljubarskyi]|nr:hypothetical protein BV20DRAFT_627933 [Pilatotrama ljubarskyi]